MGILTKWDALSRCTAADCLVRNDYHILVFAWRLNLVKIPFLCYSTLLHIHVTYTYVVIYTLLHVHAMQKSVNLPIKPPLF